MMGHTRRVRTAHRIMKRIAVLGAGGMGTALSLLFARTALTVRLWAREPARAVRLEESRENARHLPGIRLPNNVLVTPYADDATNEAELIVVAIPSAHL